MTDPIENPPNTVLPGPIPVRSQVASWKAASAASAS